MINSCAGLGALEDGRLVHEQLAALEDGRCVHVQIIESGWDSNLFVGSSLVDMYAKCESMEDAWKVFNKMPSQNVVSWNAILGGCVMHGHGKEALKHFDRMHEEGVQPDDITFVLSSVSLLPCRFGG